MPNYKALYFNLFNSVTDTIERLQQAQQQAEEQYLQDDPPIIHSRYKPRPGKSL